MIAPIISIQLTTFAYMATLRLSLYFRATVTTANVSGDFNYDGIQQANPTMEI